MAAAATHVYSFGCLEHILKNDYPETKSLLDRRHRSARMPSPHVLFSNLEEKQRRPTEAV